MKVIYNNIIPFPAFDAINLFGVLFARKETEKFSNTQKWHDIINHEEIHTAQMEETLYVGFYILYILFWLFRLLQTWSFEKAYFNISFEQEAYEFEKDFTYLERRQPYAWMSYQFLTSKK